MANLFEEFRTVVRALATAGTPFAVCGGLAMSIHAHPRATIDIDLIAPPDAIGRIAEALAAHGFLRREPTVMHRLTKIVPGDIEVLVLDIIEAREGATEGAWQTRTSMEWDGHTVPVVSRAGLIALKRLRGSPQDTADIAALEGGA